MSKKRRIPSDASSMTSGVKKSRLLDQDNDNSPFCSPQSKVDPTYSQRGVFPGLDDICQDNDLFYGPANDGLEYLRMVRYEAKGVPNLLVAPTSPKFLEQDLYADYPEGFYSDGAYTAVPPLPSAATPDTDETDPQEAYYISLLNRFTTLRSVLRSAPSIPHLDHTVKPLMQKKRAVWRGKLLKTTPTFRSLSQLPQDIIVFGMDVLAESLTQTNLCNRKYGKNLGAWSWGLLSACREVGQMGSEEVGVVREVGKQAAWLLRRINAGNLDEVEDMEAEVDEDGAEEAALRTDTNALVTTEESEQVVEDFAKSPAAVDANSDDPIAAAKQRLLSSLHIPELREAAPAAVDEQQANGDIQQQEEGEEDVKPAVEDPYKVSTTPELTSKSKILATLDMIVTIVGEAYGQRDLLDGRLLWDEL